MDAIARHQADGPPDLLKPAERGELIEQEENRPRRFDGRAGEIAQGGVDHQAQPAVIGFEPVGRQDQKHRYDAGNEIGKSKIRPRERVGDARAIEKLRVALRRRDDAGKFGGAPCP